MSMQITKVPSNELTSAEAAAITSNENIVSFTTGPVNWTMPTTWPFVITGLDLSGLGESLQPAADFLQVIMNIASTVTSPLYMVFNPLLSVFQDILEATHLAYVPDMASLLAMLTQFTGVANTPDVSLRLNSTIGLANVGTHIELGNTDIDIWRGIVAGPPFPIVMPRDGQVTSFAADFNALAAVNPQQVLNIIPGLTELLDVLTSIFGVISGAVSGLSFLLKPILEGLLEPFGLTTDIPTIPDIAADFAETGYTTGQTVNITATLWQVPNTMAADPNQVNMDPTTGSFIGAPVEMSIGHGSSGIGGSTPICKINLGGIELAHLATWDATTSLPGTALNAIASVLGLNGAASVSAGESGQFASSLIVLPEPLAVNQGDSLYVEFEIESPIALAVAIAAPNMSANITYV